MALLATTAEQLTLAPDGQGTTTAPPTRATGTETATGFPCKPGDLLIEGRRPATWLDDAIAREHAITRRMGLLSKPAKRGAADAA